MLGDRQGSLRARPPRAHRDGFRLARACATPHPVRPATLLYGASVLSYARRAAEAVMLEAPP